MCMSDIIYILSIQLQSVFVAGSFRTSVNPHHVSRPQHIWQECNSFLLRLSRGPWLMTVRCPRVWLFSSVYFFHSKRILEAASETIPSRSLLWSANCDSVLLQVALVCESERKGDREREKPANTWTQERCTSVFCICFIVDCDFFSLTVLPASKTWQLS